MWPLLIFSIVTLILTIERLVFWTSHQPATTDR